ncbi:hypothetical protein WT01_21950 [Burkholderia cepacia]|uniref:SDR family oxidoreductase n=1 Tax=Burkholderia cepacia TaxID=292 RepID=UPI000752A6EA|nr:SDR family NAD(P)-dependent oxidoreductase [Burkholderia cepacia]KVH35243.1 hypothetical protein WS88_19625 [Burkholderia cepacia]KVL56360.1 hypothetical protein WT01_21950 [Burkholderia cepacia]
MTQQSGADRPVALVTGASRGIGRAVARGLAADGYTVALVARTAAALETVAADIAASGAAPPLAHAIDVGDEAAIADVIRAVHARTGRIDVLFNGAGIVRRGTAALSDADARELIDTNLLGALNVIRAVAPFMRRSGSGHIVNVASRSALLPKAGNGGYAASKAALRAYGDALYQELARDGVKVTTLCPSYVHTEQSARQTWLSDDDKIPAEDVYRTVRYLLSLSRAASVRELTIECTHVVAHGEQYV